MFKIQLYQNTTENNRVDKTDYITLISEINGTLKEGTSIVNPTIVIESNQYRYNYVHIATFNRYYFVVDTRILRNNLVEISLKCDVLMSYKTDILFSEMLVSRNEYQYTSSYEDDKIITYYRKGVTEVEPTNLTTITLTELCSTTYPTDKYNVIINGIFDTSSVSPYSQNITSSNNVNPNINSSQQFRYSGQSADNSITAITSIANLRKILVWLEDKSRSSYINSIIVLPYYVEPMTNNGSPYSFTLKINGEDSGIYIFYPKYNISEYINIANFSMVNYKRFSPDNNFLNYEPYTKYELFIPYTGWIDLNYSLIKNANILVQYVVNYIDGSAQVSVINTTNNLLLYQGSCQLGIRIGVNSTNNYDISILKAQNIIGGTLSALKNIWNIGSGAVNIANGLALSDVGINEGSFSMSNSGVSQANSGRNSIVTNSIDLVGGIANTILKDKQLYATANAQITGGTLSLYSPQKCRLRTSYVEIADYSVNFAKMFGKPLNDFRNLNDLYGFTVIGREHLNTFLGATVGEMNEIKSLLYSGVYLKDYNDEEPEAVTLETIEEVGE